MGGSGWITAALAAVLVGAVALLQPSSGDRTTLAPTSFSICRADRDTNCVVDGDTFRVGRERVRIERIDTPEIRPSRCAREARLGAQATERLRQLLSAGPITLIKNKRDRDRNGRLLRSVAVNGRDVGATLVSEGLAREYRGRKEAWCS